MTEFHSCKDEIIRAEMMQGVDDSTKKRINVLALSPLMDAGKYHTITTPVTGAYRDRGSKFLAYAYPVNHEQDIKDHLRDLKKEHAKAVHHCYAWRIGTGGLQYRANDDGEPAGSAGKPILGQIDSYGLTNVLVVVVRYFGGTLLGIPGLINAYKTATQEALNTAQVVEKWVQQTLTLSFDYPAMGEVLYNLKQFDGNVSNQQMGLFCEMIVQVPVKHAANCIAKLNEIKSVTAKATVDTAQPIV
jgi:uncharacterized YigZ family protein